MKPKIKICGLTSLPDARLAASLGADYLGFIVDYPKSPRQLSATAAQKIMQAIKLEFPQISCVAVCVDQEFLAAKNLALAGFSVLQLHGSESPEYSQALRESAEIWKALIIKTSADLKNIEQYRAAADKILFDAGRGSSRELNRQLLEGISVDILAGGLTPQNVRAAIDELRPEIVDLNSGVESAPGKKDPAKLRAAVAAINSLATRRYPHHYRRG